MKKAFFAALLMLASLSASGIVTVKTNIDVQADISTSVRIYVEGNDVTNGTISLALGDKSGYMTGLTPEFHFIGNASAVSLSLNPPPDQSLVSDNGDKMRLNTAWVRPGGGDVSTSYPISNLPVYPGLADIVVGQGVRVRFTSAYRSETYPLGLYSGTYEVTVTPSV